MKGKHKVLGTSRERENSGSHHGENAAQKHCFLAPCQSLVDRLFVVCALKSF